MSAELHVQDTVTGDVYALDCVQRHNLSIGLLLEVLHPRKDGLAYGCRCPDHTKVLILVHGSSPIPGLRQPQPDDGDKDMAWKLTATVEKLR